MNKFHIHYNFSDLDKAIKDISMFDARARLRIEEAIREAAGQVRREAVKRVPVRSGKLKKSIRQKFSASALSGEVYSFLPYAHLAEFGAKATVIRPKKKKALRINENGIIRFAKVVHIPQRQGHPFMRPAYDYVEPKFIEAIKKAVRKK